MKILLSERIRDKCCLSAASSFISLERNNILEILLPERASFDSFLRIEDPDLSGEKNK
jgi:hypothetical protein